ncbi:MAG: urea transporter, partial [Chloroflexota bacterium]|nr:urea transporter [Chloroflexota bacterium]
LNWRSFLYTMLAAAAGGVVSAALYVLFRAFLLPPLAAPFNIVVLLFLLVPRIGVMDWRRYGLALVPIDLLGKPNAVLQWRGPREGWARDVKTELILPFYGTWHVSQGNHGYPTHWGHGSHAWDFIVMGENNKSHRGLGRECADYYAYGLPVIAPAPGRVAVVVDEVLDNIPPAVNEEQNWGNYVIIDHGNGEYSELSHFKEKGIVVKVGDQVARGQLLGYCGSTGHSEEPHLHYQLQAGDFVGARSLPAQFSYYVKVEGDRDIPVRRGIPQRGDQVRNREGLISLVAQEVPG